MRRTLLRSLLALLVLGAPAARAEEPESTIVTTSPCDAASWTGSTFVALLRVELAGEHVKVEPAGTAPAGEKTLAARPDTCEEDATGATLTLTRDGARTERHVDLTGVTPNARARVLALVAAELLRGVPASPAPAPAPPPAPPPAPMELRITVDAARPPQSPPPARASAPRPPMAPSRAVTLSLATEARAFPLGAAGLLGARAGVALPVGSLFALTADAGATFGGAHDPLGDVDTILVTGGAGVAIAAGPPSMRLLLGPRLELGWVRFGGHAGAAGTLASTADSVVALLALSATFHVAAHGGVWALVGLDAGADLYGYAAHADGRRVTAIDGPSLGVRLGLAWSAGTP